MNLTPKQMLERGIVSDFYINIKVLLLAIGLGVVTVVL